MTLAPANVEETMKRALELATSNEAPKGVNPRVGCVIVSDDGSVIGEGFHRGAGTPHAEIVALTQAGDQARGATAIVTLEPCNHHGRTGPCAQALIEAGIVTVVYAIDDPSALASGGAEALKSAGIEVTSDVCGAQARQINYEWFLAHELQRPFVRWKVATTLDGRVARSEGSRDQITGERAMARVQELRRESQAVIVGTGTALIDNPRLTVREGGPQPLRVVVGERAIPDTYHVNDGQVPTLTLSHREPAEVLSELWDKGVRVALLESGPTLAAAFLRAGLIDEIVHIQAPMVWGSGPLAFIEPFQARLMSVDVLGDDVALVLAPRATRTD